MSGFKEYVKDVMGWNKQLIDFLETEQVDKNEGIWGELDPFY